MNGLDRTAPNRDNVRACILFVKKLSPKEARVVSAAESQNNKVRPLANKCREDLEDVN